MAEVTEVTDKDLAIVILAAGMGTRMKSRQAKVLHRAGGRTLIEHVVHLAGRFVPPERTFVVIGHQADAVRSSLASTGVQFIEQTEQLGTGHALLVGRKQLEQAAGNLLVLYGDVPLLREASVRALLELHNGSKAACSLLTTEVEHPTGYGRIIRDDDGRVTGIVEHKACTPEQIRIREINPGIYCFRTETLYAHIGKLNRNNPAREYYLTDMIHLVRAAGLTLDSLKVTDSSEVLGINNRAELADMDARFRDRKARELMLSGVTLIRPETCIIDSGVEIGMDSVVGPCVALYGNTRIGADCTVRPFTTIRDSVLDDKVTVEECCWIESTRVGSGAKIGPYARLRPGSEIGPDVHIGNFVETKKTKMGRGSKANHLAYLGDATIGERVNVGAGTITCNYDGVNKHPTTIEDGAFVGTNNSLVAPVTIGKEAYTAAGSTITEDVPPGALAIGRGRQVNKENWKKK